MFKIDQQVIFLGNNNNDVSKQEIKGGKITRVGRDTVWLDHQHRPEDQVFAVYLWPDNERCRLHLQATLDMQARHKQEQAEHMTMTYMLNNEMIKAGLK
jgi:hypothetical protein